MLDSSVLSNRSMRLGAHLLPTIPSVSAPLNEEAKFLGPCLLSLVSPVTCFPVIKMSEKVHWRPMGESFTNTPGRGMPLLRPGYLNNCEVHVLKTWIFGSQEIVYRGGAEREPRVRGAPGVTLG